MNMADFFALEAGEYLDRLDAVLKSDDLNANEFVRMTRALRGAALMSGHNDIARSIQGLELVAKAISNDTRAWNTETQSYCTRAVTTIRTFVERSKDWSDRDAAEADTLGKELETLAGTPSSEYAIESRVLDAGARAFVAREGAAVASALDRAGNAIKLNPSATEPAQAVLRSLQPLQGLAALKELPPLPELLSGIERAVAETTRLGSQAVEPGAIFQAAAQALARAARQVAEKGKPEPETPETQVFAEQLRNLLHPDADAIPVESLFYDDDGPHIVQRGQSADVMAASLTPIELVTIGASLRQAADELRHATGTTQRDLQTQALSERLRSLEASGGTALGGGVTKFATAARRALQQGAATADPSGFAETLSTAGGLMSRALEGDDDLIRIELQRTAEAMSQVAPARPTPPAHPTPPQQAPAARPAAPAPAPVAQQTGDRPPDGKGLPTSWRTFEQLTSERDPGDRELTALLSGTASATTTAAPAPATPPAASSADDVVSITELEYDGKAALQRVLELRQELPHTSDERRHALLDEIFDLVSLAAKELG